MSRRSAAWDIIVVRSARAISKSPLAGPIRAFLNAARGPGPALRVMRLHGPGAGLRMKLHYASQKSYALGIYERNIGSMLQACVMPGATVWDVGAHIGYYALVLSNTVGSQGLVVAFEPHPDTRRVLQENVGLNHLTNVLVRSEALGEGPRKAMLQPVGNSLLPAGSTIVHPMAAPSALAHPVEVMDGDRLVEGGLPAPDVVKIDVEGAAGLVLQGLVRTLRRHGPTLVIELHPQSLEGEVKAVRDLLAALEYVIVQEVDTNDHGWGLIHLVARPRRQEAMR